MHQPKGHPPRLPEPQMLPREAADPPMEGWWVDPFPKGPFAQRYHDGTQWTAFVSYRRGGLWSDIVEMPLTDGPRA